MHSLYLLSVQTHTLYDFLQYLTIAILYALASHISMHYRKVFLAYIISLNTFIETFFGMIIAAFTQMVHRLHELVLLGPSSYRFSIIISLSSSFNSNGSNFSVPWYLSRLSRHREKLIEFHFFTQILRHILCDWKQICFHCIVYHTKFYQSRTFQIM